MESSQWENWNHHICSKVSFLTAPHCQFRGVGQVITSKALRSPPWLGWTLWNICVTNDHGYVPLVVNTTRCRENNFVCERNVQNFPIHVIRAVYIDVSLYLTLTIQTSSRLKRSANHLWNSSDVQNDRDIRLLIKFPTVYTCITFHFLH
jgi:hypothetical protein